MNEQLYYSLKKLLSLRDAGEIKNYYCFKNIDSFIQEYDIKNNPDYAYLKDLMNDFGISELIGRNKRCGGELAIKRAIFFNYIYNKYYLYLSIKSMAAIIGVTRSNCYNYIKKYPIYERFYPITKELQNEFNLIIKKYEKE